jgi:hypothetical protein
MIPEGGNNANGEWINTGNAVNAPDGLYAITNLGNNLNELGLSGFNSINNGGNITSVEFVTYIREEVNLTANNNLTIFVYHGDAVLTDGIDDAEFQYFGNDVTYFQDPVGTVYQISEDITSTTFQK